MNKIKVGIIFGGRSAEYKISLISAIEVIKSIDRDKFLIIPIFINRYGKWFTCKQGIEIFDSEFNIKKFFIYAQEIYLATGNSKKKIIVKNNVNIFYEIDVIFPVLHGIGGEDGSLQGLLKTINIPYVGSDILSSAISMNKLLTKTVLHNNNFNVAPFIMLNKCDIISFDEIISILGKNFFVKPICQGSSIGITKVLCRKDFKRSLDVAFHYNDKIILEKEIIGREISCAVLGKQISTCGEVILKKNSFYTYNMKYKNNENSLLVIPAKLNNYIINLIRYATFEVFSILQCTDLARVDFFLTTNNKLIVNEVNTIPGFSKCSIYPKLWKYSGISYKNLITKLIELAISKKIN